jgi:hypothetical protein
VVLPLFALSHHVVKLLLCKLSLRLSGLSAAPIQLPAFIPRKSSLAANQPALTVSPAQSSPCCMPMWLGYIIPSRLACLSCHRSLLFSLHLEKDFRPFAACYQESGTTLLVLQSPRLWEQSLDKDQPTCKDLLLDLLLTLQSAIFSCLSSTVFAFIAPL